jgi:hypothetical protein
MLLRSFSSSTMPTREIRLLRVGDIVLLQEDIWRHTWKKERFKEFKIGRDGLGHTIILATQYENEIAWPVQLVISLEVHQVVEDVEEHVSAWSICI